MATYLEVHELASNDSLRNRVAVAMAVSAQAMLAGTPTEKQSRWARSVINDSLAASRQVLSLVLAANRGLTKTQIETASDAGVQSAVDAVVPGLVNGEILPASP